MKIEIKKLDIDNDEYIRSIVRWENSDNLYHLITPVKCGDTRKKHTVDSLKKKYKEGSDSVYIYMILDGEKPIGNFSVQMNFKYLMKKGEETSWIGLNIGEKEYWGTGIAKIAMDYIERESKKIRSG